MNRPNLPAPTNGAVAEPAPPAAAESIRDELAPQTSLLLLIATLLVAAAAWVLGTILVPFALAVVLAIALTPLANRLERRGAPRVVASLAAMLLVAGLVLGTLTLMLVQAGRMFGQSDQLIAQTAGSLDRISGYLGGGRALHALGVLGGDSRASSSDSEASAEREATPEDGPAAWEALLRDGLRATGGWLASGLGGLAGAIGGLIVLLAFLFYLIHTRAELSERLVHTLKRLGLEPRARTIERSRHEIVVFVGFVSLVAASYAVVGSLIYWGIGLPSPLLWGALTGLLEFIPFFGPMIAGVLVTAVALAEGTLWQPAVIVILFLVLHLVEGYIITPMVYGSAVEIGPVASLLGVLFFGWLWGPLGSVLAMPMLILLRGLVVMAPDTPALDALADVEDRKPAVLTPQT